MDETGEELVARVVGQRGHVAASGSVELGVAGVGVRTCRSGKPGMELHPCGRPERDLLEAHDEDARRHTAGRDRSRFRARTAAKGNGKQERDPRGMACAE